MLAKDVSDKEPRGAGGVVKWGSARDKDAAKDMAFLPPCVWTRRFARGKRMLSHIPAHSFFSPSLFSCGHNHMRTLKRKKTKQGSWPWSFTLWQETLRQSQREERHNSYFLPQNLQRLPMKRETVQ